MMMSEDDIAVVYQEKYTELNNKISIDDSGLKEDAERYTEWEKYILDEKNFENSKEFYIFCLAEFRKMGSLNKNVEKIAIDSAKKINEDDTLRCVYEIIQNADDCEYAEGITPKIKVAFGEDKIIFQYPEKGMNYLDVYAITDIGNSSKKNIEKRQIGEKGIGFKTIFAISKEVDIYSNGYNFSLSGESLQPELIEDVPDGYDNGTTVVVHIENNENISTTDIYNKLKGKYGVDNIDNKSFQHCPIMFTNRLKKITMEIGENSENSFSIEKNINVESEVFIEELVEFNISYTIKNQNVENIKNTLECYAFKKNIVFNYEQYNSRYNSMFEKVEFENKISENIKSYSIILVAPKDTSEIKNGNVYSYLPTGTNIKAPLNIQIPLKLNQNRSSMWFVGDTDTTTENHSNGLDETIETIEWNKALLKELYTLIPTFYEQLKIKADIDILKYIPKFKDNNHFLFESEEKYAESIRKLNEYCKSVNDKNIYNLFKDILYLKLYVEDEYTTFEDAIMFDEFIMDTFGSVYFEKNKDDFDENDKNKKLVAFYDFGDIHTFGFKSKKVNNDEEKTKYLNTASSSNNRKEKLAISNEILKLENSRYIPKDIQELNIIPTNNKDGKVLYTSYSNKYILKCDEPLKYSNNEKLFVLSNVDDFAEFYNNDNNTYLGLKCYTDIWDILKNEKGVYKELFIECMDFIKRYDENNENLSLYEYCKNLLLNDNDDNNEKIINIINNNIKKLIGGDNNG